MVILGQDPYHGRGQAEGLAFSVSSGCAPSSVTAEYLQNAARFGHTVPSLSPAGGSLVSWAQHGAFNTCLTVEEGQAASHAKRGGWGSLTDAIIRQVAEQGRPTVFMLWGSHAQSSVSLFLRIVVIWC